MSHTALFEQLKTHKKLLNVLICEDSKEAEKLQDVCKYLEQDVILFPDIRANYLDDLRSYTEEMFELFTALRKYYASSTKPLVIAPFKTLLYNLPKEKLLQAATISFADLLNIAELKSKLLEWGYTFVDIVQVEGEVSFRGDIIDIFIPSSENPYRISLFDTEVEEIKEFSCDTQRSQGSEVESITLTSAFYSLNSDEYEQIMQKIESSRSDSFSKDITSLGFWYLDDLAENFLEGKKALFSKIC